MASFQVLHPIYNLPSTRLKTAEFIQASSAPNSALYIRQAALIFHEHQCLCSLAFESLESSIIEVIYSSDSHVSTAFSAISTMFPGLLIKNKLRPEFTNELLLKCLQFNFKQNLFKKGFSIINNVYCKKPLFFSLDIQAVDFEIPITNTSVKLTVLFKNFVFNSIPFTLPSSISKKLSSQSINQPIRLMGYEGSGMVCRTLPNLEQCWAISAMKPDEKQGKEESESFDNIDFLRNYWAIVHSIHLPTTFTLVKVLFGSSTNPLTYPLPCLCDVSSTGFAVNRKGMGLEEVSTILKELIPEVEFDESNVINASLWTKASSLGTERFDGFVSLGSASHLLKNEHNLPKEVSSITNGVDEYEKHSEHSPPHLKGEEYEIGHMNDQIEYDGGIPCECDPIKPKGLLGLMMKVQNENPKPLQPLQKPKVTTIKKHVPKPIKKSSALNITRTEASTTKLNHNTEPPAKKKKVDDFRITKQKMVQVFLHFLGETKCLATIQNRKPTKEATSSKAKPSSRPEPQNKKNFESNAPEYTSSLEAKYVEEPKQTTTHSMDVLLSMHSEGKLSKLTVPELKAFLKSNGLKVSGKKADLIERVVEFLNSKQ
ncbi:hypothetical protein P9112_004263 [Eukaryota sp. TZLM1-RC]